VVSQNVVNLRRGHVPQVGSVHNAGLGVSRVNHGRVAVSFAGDVLDCLVVLADDVDALGDGFGCDGVIASDHDYLNTCRPALLDGVWHGGSRRVDHRHQADKAEVHQREILLVGVEVEAVGELVGGQAEVAEAENSLAHAAQLFVGCVECGLPLLVHQLILSIDKNMRTPVQYSLRRPLHNNQVSLISVVSLMY